MKAAQDEVRQVVPITSRFSDFDVPAAYVVADLIHQARVQEGAIPVGRKIGFTNPDMWSLYGIREPIWAYVYDTTVVHLGKGPQSCSIGRFTEPKIEPEIIFHFRSAPPASGSLAAYSPALTGSRTALRLCNRTFLAGNSRPPTPSQTGHCMERCWWASLKKLIDWGQISSHHSSGFPWHCRATACFASAVLGPKCLAVHCLRSRISSPSSLSSPSTCLSRQTNWSLRAPSRPHNRSALARADELNCKA